MDIALVTADLEHRIAFHVPAATMENGVLELVKGGVRYRVHVELDRQVDPIIAAAAKVYPNPPARNFGITEMIAALRGMPFRTEILVAIEREIRAEMEAQS
jgi:hypothetical protein